MSRIRKRGMAPRLPTPAPEYSKTWADSLIRALEQQAALEGRPIIGGYAVTNYTVSRSLNAGTATATDVANFVATLVDDLIAAGVIAEA